MIFPAVGHRLDSDGAPQPIDAGVRLSGKMGIATNVGAMHMQTGDSENGIAGVDFMTDDPSAPFERGRIVEVNFCPGWQTVMAAWPGPRGTCPTEAFHRILDAPGSQRKQPWTLLHY